MLSSDRKGYDTLCDKTTCSFKKDDASEVDKPVLSEDLNSISIPSLWQ
ncbi:MAG: hypothetical protein M3162_02140 [Thermoproteota archaeon]|nr:hypothetical protein [Thermoproteota archaeon]